MGTSTNGTGNSGVIAAARRSSPVKRSSTKHAPSRAPADAKSELWQRLRAMRRYADLRQIDVAKRIGKSRATIALWESHLATIRTMPSAEDVRKYCEICNVSFAYAMDNRSHVDDVYKMASVGREAPAVAAPAPAAIAAPALSSKQAMPSIEQLLTHWSDLNRKVLTAEAALDTLKRERDALLQALDDAVQGRDSAGTIRRHEAQDKPAQRDRQHRPAEPADKATDDLQTVNASELGKLIGRSTLTVRADVHRRPDSLPPRIITPGSNRLLWRVVDVRQWMQSLADLESERQRAAAEAAKRAGSNADFSRKLWPPSTGGDRR